MTTDPITAEILQTIEKGRQIVRVALLAVAPAISFSQDMATELLSIAEVKVPSNRLIGFTGIQHGNGDQFYIEPIELHKELLDEWKETTPEYKQLMAWVALTKSEGAAAEKSSGDAYWANFHRTRAAVYSCQNGHAGYLRDVQAMLKANTLHIRVMCKAAKLGLTEKMNLPDDYLAAIGARS